jgi:hypothetical protein
MFRPLRLQPAPARRSDEAPAGQASTSCSHGPCGPFFRCNKQAQKSAITFQCYGEAGGPVATGSAAVIAKNLFCFAREFWWDEPEKFSFFRFRIDVEQRHAGFGKFERSTGQFGNHSREIRLVPDQHQNF